MRKDGAETSAAEILTRAADLIEPEGAWTTTWLARTANGNPVGPLTPGAACWCALGAITRAAGTDAGVAAYSDSLRAVVGDSVARFNDNPRRTQAEVVAALRKAAELARGAA